MESENVCVCVFTSLVLCVFFSHFFVIFVLLPFFIVCFFVILFSGVFSVFLRERIHHLMRSGGGTPGG